jgi:hypothetical protein
MGLEQLLQWLGQAMPRASLRFLGGSLLLAFVACQPVSEAIGGNINRSLPDTRILAREWIQANLPAGSAVAVDAYAAPLDADRFRLMKTFSLSYNTLEYYREEEIEYLVTSSYMYDRFETEAYRYPNNVEFYERVQDECSTIYRVSPIRWQRVGPTVSVYHLAVAQDSQ